MSTDQNLLSGIRSCLRHPLCGDGSLRSALFPAKGMPQTRPGYVRTIEIAATVRCLLCGISKRTSELSRKNVELFTWLSQVRPLVGSFIAGNLLSFLILGISSSVTIAENAAAIGVVSRFIDGDTVEVRLEHGDVRVRLHAIDTPDMEQAYYAEANMALVDLIGDKKVELLTATEDRGRLGAVIMVDGKDINAEMIRNGFAYAYRKYLGLVDADAAYCELEHEARVAGRGIWALPAEDRIAPWEIRDYWRGNRSAFTDFSKETVANCQAASGKPDRVPGSFAFAPIPGLDPPDPDCPIKGSVSFTGKRRYMLPDHRDYRTTYIDPNDGERWFCSEREALEAEWQPAR